MNIVLFGGPGAGKDSIAKFLAEDFGLVHVSSGDIFRKHIAEQTEIGKSVKAYIDQGNLVPDELTIAIVMDRLAQDDCANGFILDGFPRTVAQASAFLKQKPIDAIVHISVDEETVVARLSGRYKCTTCHEPHNKLWHKGIECSKCGGPLSQRDDDREEIVRKRFNDYKETETAMLDFYKSLLVKVLPVESKLVDPPKSMYSRFLDDHVKSLNYIAATSKAKSKDVKK
ncbi:MAG: nucleoside monophosphate kinase [Firmicutes bacterium]|nr:nucleoside monophosphate kinase [Bacillota bacterium]